jgi:hypothetical protein
MNFGKLLAACWTFAANKRVYRGQIGRAARFVCVDHDTPLLMPPDLRELVPEDHLVHFIMEAFGLID